MEYREPVKENIEKVKEVEKGRIERGESFSQQEEIVAHYMLMSEPTGIMIVETDDYTRIAKWVKTYLPYMKYKISPVMTREEFEKSV
jgi:hypothetical protein